MLYIANTDASVLLELGTQMHHVLVSGRWYRSKSFDGPWECAAADQLPPSFGNVPADSEVGDVRASVAGTDEAKDAVMDAQIPQTATIKREPPDLKVTYDGNPKFKAIEGRKLACAENSKFTVITTSTTATPTAGTATATASAAAREAKRTGRAAGGAGGRANAPPREAGDLYHLGVPPVRGTGILS